MSASTESPSAPNPDNRRRAAPCAGRAPVGSVAARLARPRLGPGGLRPVGVKSLCPHLQTSREAGEEISDGVLWARVVLEPEPAQSSALRPDERGRAGVAGP